MNKRTCEAWYKVKLLNKQARGPFNRDIYSCPPVQIRCSSDFHKGKYLPFSISQAKLLSEETARSTTSLNWKISAQGIKPKGKNGKKVFFISFPN